MRKSFIGAATLLIGISLMNSGDVLWKGVLSAHAATANAFPAQSAKRITVPAGIRILIRMADAFKRGFSACMGLEILLGQVVRRCDDRAEE